MSRNFLHVRIKRQAQSKKYYVFSENFEKNYSGEKKRVRNSKLESPPFFTSRFRKAMAEEI